MYTTPLGTSIMFLAFGLTTAFPNGAHNNGSNPLDALSSYCTAGNFRPNHGDNMPQATSPPFKITVTSPAGNIYKPQQAVTVTLEPRMTAAGAPMAMIKGFFLQGDSTESTFGGDWQCDPQHGQVTVFCGKSGMTHTNAMPKAKVVCRWTPPDFQIGKVQFVATVLENFTHFWTGVKSHNILLPDPNAMTFSQKAQQFSRMMMGQLQGHGQTPNLMNLMSKLQQGNPLLNHFKGSADTSNSNQNSNNPFANLMSMAQGFGNNAVKNNNPFAAFAGIGGGNPGETNAWSTAGGQQSQSRGFQAYDRNPDPMLANFPASFQSFFQQ